MRKIWQLGAIALIQGMMASCNLTSAPPSSRRREFLYRQGENCQKTETRTRFVADNSATFKGDKHDAAITRHFEYFILRRPDGEPTACEDNTRTRSLPHRF